MVVNMSDAPALLSAAEVAAILKVSPMSVYRWADQGILDAIRIGGIVRFRQSDVDALIAAGPVAS